MAVSVVLGLQWGDEGKGKIVDYYSASADVVVRATGGNNAGHTVVIGDKTYKLHLLPSGLFQDNKTGVLGNGMVIDLQVLCKELAEFEARSNGSKVFISGKAHVIMPWHKHFDAAGETASGIKKIGTTGRGIGPCYEAKANRSSAIRFYDLTSGERFEKKVQEVYNLLKPRFEQTGFTLSVAQILAELEPLREKLAPFVIDSTNFLLNCAESGKEILIEGAQGALLDFDHGTFPFVTSSNPTIGGAFTGTGLPHSGVEKVIGVTKAYTTRVGSGPFPTKLIDADGDYLQSKGAEFGTTTGRKRDCGWLDVVALRYAVKINGVSELALTKLDVLGGLEKIKVATSYALPNGSVTSDFPEDTAVLAGVEPVYAEFNGWGNESLLPEWEKLPVNARSYVGEIEKLAGVPVKLVSVGPERTQTIAL
ncbi:MAG: adenylosuccinate synthase [Candidatus Micrarchaeota archaeon]|nr:adenylosuccinate synthase [Candidatus Micrarchaeota archaeon]